MKFLAALQFLTIIPIHRGFSAEEIGRSPGYFPLAGLFIGLIPAGFGWLLDRLFPLALVNILVLVIFIVLTGALHLDGFLDTCDGIAVHRTAQDKLKVMRDSRAGGFGVIGVCCLLLLKYVSLSSIPEVSRMAALVLMPVLGRWAAVYAIFVYPYIRPDGTGRVFEEQKDWKTFILATVTALLIVLVFGSLGGVAAMFGTWMIVMATATYLRNTFGGLTGDTYGAIIEVSETGVLRMVSLFVHHHWLWARP